MLDPRSSNFYDATPAVIQPRFMHLRNRGGGERRETEIREELVNAASKGSLDFTYCKLTGESLYVVLEIGECDDVFIGQQLAMHAQSLAKLDEWRSQSLKHTAESLRGG